jgi:hypothetical protein
LKKEKKNINEILQDLIRCRKRGIKKGIPSRIGSRWAHDGSHSTVQQTAPVHAAELFVGKQLYPVLFVQMLYIHIAKCKDMVEAVGNVHIGNLPGLVGTRQIDKAETSIVQDERKSHSHYFVQTLTSFTRSAGTSQVFRS